MGCTFHLLKNVADVLKPDLMFMIAKVSSWRV